jgi:glyoxylase-like metal-dependent hydrolase (beta-lactamase superfamily II)
MRRKTLPRTTALGALAVSMAFAGLAPVTAAAEGGASAPTAAAAGQALGQAGGPQARAALRLAASAVGGAADLRGLRSYRYRTRGQRWIFDEGVRPGNGIERSATFTNRVRYTLPGGARERLRVDSVRTSVGAARPVHEVLAGRRGFIRGVDANGSTAALKPMTSDRWAAIRRQQLLLNPHVMLRKALRNPRLARSGGTRTLDGRRYRVLVIRDRVAPMRLFVDRATGRLARLRTMQHDYFRRDVVVEAIYRRWRRAGAGLSFPRSVTLRSDGLLIQREVRRGVQANAAFAPRVFRFPANLGPAPFQPQLARIGARTSEWIMGFANLGFIKDGGQRAINPQAVAPGVILLGGVANNSLVVRRTNGVVVFEGAVHDMRAEAVIAFVRRRFPNLPITHVVTTHHHSDHAGGMRPYVAIGARVVVHRRAVPFFRRVFRARNSTILPDRLDRSNRPARILPVTAAGRTLANAGTDVEVYPVQTGHSVDMVVPYAEDTGVLFTSDIYSPPGLPDPQDPDANAIADMVEARGLNAQFIAGGHGTVIAYDDFEAALGR